MGIFLDVFKVFWLFSWLVIASLLLFIPVTTVALFSRTGNLAFNFSKAWAWIVLKISCVRTRIRGRENIQKGQSYIIISNHQSHFDIPALVTRLGIQYRWIIKKELLKVPLFGYALYASKNVFIDRSNPQKAIASINSGMARLPKGASVMFFAEGTRSSDGRIQEFKKGGFAIAVQKGIPILPVTVNGSRKILPKKALVFHSGEIEVVVDRPIETRGYTMERLDELIKKTREVIIANFNPEYAPGAET
ncbi:MAG: lysophospholipid acyltransferase family protein [Smithellaceae bacterium]|nr:lysophospholipid acyltransferase family protein [Smithellaceae bacterium]